MSLSITVVVFLSFFASLTYGNNKINLNPNTGNENYYIFKIICTVDSLDVAAYLGLWYQMSSDKLVLSTTEKNVYCATALYGDNGLVNKNYNYIKLNYFIVFIF